MQPRLFAARCVAALLGAGALLATPAVAETFTFVYTGTFNSADALNLEGAPTNYFTDTTPFTVNALFDDASPNLVAPVGVTGFVSYSPLRATLTVNGQTYDIATYDQDPTRGVTVVLFDDTTPFVTGRYGAGLIQNPLADGAGFVGDFLSAAPPFSAAHLVPTVFTDYQGVGYLSGPGQSVVPIPLSKGGQSYLLTLGTYVEEYAEGAPLNSAQIVAVPEPGSVAFGIVAAGAITGLIVRKRKV